VSFRLRNFDYRAVVTCWWACFSDSSKPWAKRWQAGPAHDEPFFEFLKGLAIIEMSMISMIRIKMSR